MLKEALQYLLSLGETVIFPADERGRKYSNKGIVPVSLPPLDLMPIHTLDGFIDLINLNFEGIDRKGVVVIVEDEGTVKLFSRVSDMWNRRTEFLRAVLPDVKAFQFGAFIDQESFIIGLQSQFLASGDRDELTKVVSAITTDSTVLSADNGYSQEVQVKAGIALKDTTVIKPRVTLAPYRTFREIVQPSSEFIVRVRKGQNGPLVALFEADGGKWKIDAVEAINKYLRLNTAMDGVEVVS